MDLYSWIAAMGAGAPGELLSDALLAAFDAREVDMRSSPYDLSAWGLDPIPVETAEGRAEFVAFQKQWIRRTNVLRQRFLRAVDRLESCGRTGGSRGDDRSDRRDHLARVSTAGTAPNVCSATPATTRPSSE